MFRSFSFRYWRNIAAFLAVMAGLVPAIHVFAAAKDVDHRDIWREDGASRLLPR
jgi:hypothetical protein